jgi:hypothetical protein
MVISEALPENCTAGIAKRLKRAAVTTFALELTPVLFILIRPLNARGRFTPGFLSHPALG